VLHVQNWKSAAQSRQTWRKKTDEVMTRIGAETPKKRKRSREERREDREISI
jgi:carbamoylphosphate synthase large subunit